MDQLGLVTKRANVKYVVDTSFSAAFQSQRLNHKMLNHIQVHNTLLNFGHNLQTYHHPINFKLNHFCERID